MMNDVSGPRRAPGATGTVFTAPPRARHGARDRRHPGTRRDRAAPRRAASAGPTDRGRGAGGGTGLWGMGGFGTLAGMRHACRALVCSVGPPPPACRAPLDNPPGMPPGYFFSTLRHSLHVRATCLVTILRETSATVCSHLNPRAHGGDGSGGPGCRRGCTAADPH